MPTQTNWVDPELFLEHCSVRVFYTYKDDDIDQGPNRYWFSLNPECSVERTACGSEFCPHVFDVRELSCWQPSAPSSCALAGINKPDDQEAWERYWKEDENAIRIAITTAIERGEIATRLRESEVS